MRRKPELPDIAYAVPFDWGSLRVSEAAHDFYDLRPLAETTKDMRALTTVNRLNEPSTEFLPLVNVALVTNEEADKLPQAISRKGRLDIPITLDTKREDIVNGLNHTINNSGPDYYMPEAGAGSSEEFGAEIISIKLGESTFSAADEPINDRLKADYLKIVRSSIFTPGYAAASIVALQAPDLLTMQEISQGQVNFLLASIALCGITSAVILNRRFKHLPESLDNIEAEARRFSSIIAEDIHSAFSPHDFNQRMLNWPVLGENESKR